MDVVGAQAEDAGRAGDAVVDVGVGDDHRRGTATGEAGGPGVAERDVAGREQRREIGERAAGGDEAAERAGREAELLADGVDDGVFDGRGERAHLVDRHSLIRDAADEVEQRGERHGRRHLVADVVRMVQILAAGKALAGELADSVGDVRTACRLRRSEASGIADQIRRARSNSARWRRGLRRGEDGRRGWRRVWCRRLRTRRGRTQWRCARGRP